MGQTVHRCPLAQLYGDTLPYFPLQPHVTCPSMLPAFKAELSMVLKPEQAWECITVFPSAFILLLIERCWSLRTKKNWCTESYNCSSTGLCSFALLVLIDYIDRFECSNDIMHSVHDSSKLHECPWGLFVLPLHFPNNNVNYDILGTPTQKHRHMHKPMLIHRCTTTVGKD